MSSKEFVFRVFGWQISIARYVPPQIKEPVLRPRIAKKKVESGYTYCSVTYKIGYPEAMAKLRANQLEKKTLDGYLRAYKCEFCPHWHLTHKKSYLKLNNRW